jgi:hypothetical protein
MSIRSQLSLAVAPGRRVKASKARMTQCSRRPSQRFGLMIAPSRVGDATTNGQPAWAQCSTKMG